MANPSARKPSWLSTIGPGIVLAATGVGAGDLATGALTGSKLGVAVLWAVALGAFLKFVLNEGLARWQLATGTTFLEGAVERFGRVVQYAFLAYLMAWSFFVASALMSACGITAFAIYESLVPNAGDPEDGRIVFGILHSAVGVVLVQLGGYRLFEKLMSLCVVVMFFTVVITAAIVKPPWSEVLAGLVYPTIPNWQDGGLAWTIALLGGIGGTVTVLCYGYWIREEGLTSIDDLRACRVDLAVGYAAIALFGMGMIIIGSRIEVEGGGARLVVQLADQLREDLGGAGPAIRWLFLAGAWAAVFTSLFGVWQSVPYLFADFWRLTQRQAGRHVDPVSTSSRPYRFYVCAMATIPVVGLWFKFDRVQFVYAVVGAAFIPLLAIALLVLNGDRARLGDHRNSPVTMLLLGTTVVLSIAAAWFELSL